MPFVGHAIGMRSTRSPARNVEVPAPNANSPSMSFDLSL
jgi:hypothetical protein